MTLSESVKTFNQKLPDRNIVGYWIIDGNFVFNTSKKDPEDEAIEPGQYVVDSNGSVYGTNPMELNLNPSAMHKI